MKAFGIFFMVLVLLLGTAYALAFFKVIPVQKLAESNKTAMTILTAIHLAKPKPPAVAATAKPSPADDMAAELAATKAKLNKANAKVEEDDAQLALAKSASATAAPDPTGQPNGRDKLLAIFDTMSPDDVALVFEGKPDSVDEKWSTKDGKTVKVTVPGAQIPDKALVSYLMAMDEKKAGKVLAALATQDAGHAVKLTELMDAQKPRVASAQPQPLKSL